MAIIQKLSEIFAVNNDGFCQTILFVDGFNDMLIPTIFIFSSDENEFTAVLESVSIHFLFLLAIEKLQDW